MFELRLVPGTLELFDAELAADHARLARLLAVELIVEWPPIGGEHDAGAVAFFRAMLAADPGLLGLHVFYLCAGSRLVGSAGFFGRPVDGTVEIGYSVCQRERGRGFATAAVRQLVERAAEAGVRTVIAHVRDDNAPSIAVLERNRFVRRGVEAGGRLRFERALG